MRPGRHKVANWADNSPHAKRTASSARGQNSAAMSWECKNRARAGDVILGRMCKHHELSRSSLHFSQAHGAQRAGVQSKVAWSLTSFARIAAIAELYAAWNTRHKLVTWAAFSAPPSCASAFPCVLVPRHSWSAVPPFPSFGEVTVAYRLRHD